MELEDLLNAFDRYLPLTQKAKSDLQNLMEPITFQKNEYLVRSGDRASDCFVLVEGVVRVFFNADGTEYNKTFFVPGMFPTALTALISNEPAKISFQALTKCSLYRFSYREFRNLFEEHRCLESLLLRVLEDMWIKKEAQEIRMVTNNATTNYLLFQKEYPGLENLIPQYHIASHLGITPIQLSRIRAQLSKDG
ncbi:MAG: Crp/Fnr family transcriptional regulator [Allomuricauda sp.]